MTIDIYTDGGSRGNPGKAACAFVVLVDGQKIHEENKYLGLTTNNVAEYEGLLMAVKWLLENKEKYPAYQINFFLDSELVVKQLKKEYKIKDQKMKDLSQKVFDAIRENKLEPKFIHVLREKNKRADWLVNEALDNL